MCTPLRLALGRGPGQHSGMVSLILVLSAAAVAPLPSSSQCTLSADDRIANRKLSLNDFDQLGTLRSTARALAGRECFAEAVEANVDYLLQGPDLTDYERNVVRFHTGQYLASSGRESEAALIIASTRRGVDPKRPNFDWDGYIVGTYAFVTKDRPLLDAMSARLSANPDFASQMNAKVLSRFQKCFDQPYRIASGTDPRCAGAAVAPRQP